MAALTFPVPVYTTTTSTPSPFTTNKRALSTTSPGTTDNTATGVNGGTVGVHDFFRPLATFSATTGSGTSAPSPATIDYGWLLPITPTLVTANNGIKVAAGTWTIPVHYSRPGGVLTADVPATITAILVRVDSTATTNLSELGRSAATNVTATTTEQSISLSISGAETEFAPGECLMLLLYFDRAGALNSDTFRIHTNSTTAFRITAAPNYTRILYTAASSTATSTASSTGSAVAGTVGTAAGTSTTTALASSVSGSIGSSAGSATVQGQVTGIGSGQGSSNGTASAQATITAIASVVGNAAATSTVDGKLSAIASAVFDADATSSAQAFASSVSGTTGSAVASSTSDFKITKILGFIGTVDVGGSGSVINNYYRPVFVFDD